MKIALVCCPIWSPQMPPLSVSVLQAQLKKTGYDIEPIDLSIEFYHKHSAWYRYLQILSYFYRPEFSRLLYNLNLLPKNHYDEYEKKILSTGADVVCFTLYKQNSLTSLYIASRLKEHNPEKKIIFGGPSCYFKDFRSLIEKAKCVDYVVTGEGDLILLEILKKIKNKNLRIKRDILFDINQEPLPDFSGFALDKYTSKILPYSTTRGCYNACACCFDVKFWKKYRYKSANKIFRDLKKLKDLYGIDSFFFRILQ